MPRFLKLILLSIRDLIASAGPIVFLVIGLLVAAYWWLQPQPPKHVTLATGPTGSAYAQFGKRYATALKANGITVELKATSGSSENLQLLRSGGADVGFVRGGSADPVADEEAGLNSLGSLFFEPLWLFYRADTAHRVDRKTGTLTSLAQLRGLRVNVDMPGSGLPEIMERLFKANRLGPDEVQLSNLEQAAAAEALQAGLLDAIVLSSAPQSPQVQRLLRNGDIKLMDFGQADAYTRRFPFLSAVSLPRGVVDLSKDLPPADVSLLAATTSLLSRDETHPALRQLFAQAAQTVHSDAGWFNRARDFPNTRTSELPVSPEGDRAINGTPPFWQRYLPFWASNLVERMWLVLGGLLVLMLPLSRVIPPLYQFRVRRRVFRWYARLRDIEGKVDSKQGERDTLLKELDELDRVVNKVAVPLSYADELYALRNNIYAVRKRVLAGSVAAGRQDLPDGSVLQTLIDFAEPRGDAAARLRVAFGAPSRVLVARTPDEVRPVLEAVEALAHEGRWCVGYLRYEAAAAFDPAFAVHAGEGPLAWFGVHDAAQPWPEADAPGDHAPAVDWQAGLSRAAFDRNMQAIHRAIGNGELYQLNYTAPLRAEFHGDACAWFRTLQNAQPDGYAAFIDTGEEQVLSVSPELFFDWHGDQILARPMKGTAPRGATAAEDEALALRLRTVAKERAENVMIVDLIRNDLSRVAQPFSVRVPRLFHTEALPTVWQMTSDVEAAVRDGVSLVDVFAALFPCGSITGAPKVSAMRMIRELEPEARGVYCGAVGVVRPGGHTTFNVPIRTVTLRGTEARCGIGSGITADAGADAEWEEWRHKRAFLGAGSTPVSSAAMSPFELLETLALVDGALRDAPAHLSRMRNAAAHFGYPWNEALLAACLKRLGEAHSTGAWRVRLLLDAQGQPRAQAFAMDAAPARVQLQLAARAFDEADSEFSRFKTTRRAHYEAFAPTAPDVFDTLLWNRRGEITECTRGNIALLLDGRWLTPPLHCGLLNGIGRANRLRDGQLAEAVVRVDDLPRVQALAFVNSLRGRLDADLCDPQE